LGFVDAEGGFRLGQLDVGLPQRLIGPIGDVSAQEMDAPGQARSVLPRQLRTVAFIGAFFYDVFVNAPAAAASVELEPDESAEREQ